MLIGSFSVRDWTYSSVAFKEWVGCCAKYHPSGSPTASKIPADIIDGRPMRYSIISPTEYRLYSVGWNESDELGIAVGYGIKKSFPRHEEGDWVWFSRRATPER